MLLLQLMNFTAEIVNWYQRNKRDLPWRNTKDAYVIWLSEIILQQTRVEQGLPYFYRFIENYPGVQEFAAAAEDDILKLWQGLGYYSRGRNMLKTARQVAEQYGGEFPVRYEDLINLKGIGEYTAAAISSFAAGEARAVIDGNVYRVIARYFGIHEPVNSTAGKKLFRQIADDLLNREQPGLHNQAMMEFGAMLCKPQNPLCDICPVRAGCLAHRNNEINRLPVKLKTVKIKERFFNYLLITDGQTILLNKRGENDIWANMYDLPLIETDDYILPEQLAPILNQTGFFEGQAAVVEIFTAKKHVLTHQHIYAQFIRINTPPVQLQTGWFYADIKNLEKLALPKIIFTFINNLFNL